MVLKYLIQKEFKQFVRNSFMPKLMVMFPLMMILVMPWAATQEIKNVKIVFVDQDHSVESRRLQEKATASGYFLSAGNVDSYQEASDLIQRSKADIIMTIAPDFGKNLFRPTEDSRVMISANAVNGTKGQLGSAYLNQIVQDFNQEIIVEQTAQPSISQKTLSLSERYLFNPTLDYKRFMIPAMMTMLLTLLAGFLPALNIVGEKEKGTIEQMNVSPVTRLQFILAKLLPYWLMGFLVLNFALFLAWLTYGFAPAGSMLSIYAFASVYILLISGMGLIISNYSDTMQQAMFVMFFFMLIFLLMSGLFTPTASMPDWAQTIAACNPLKYFIDAMRMIFLRGSNVQQLLPNFIILLAIGLFLNAWAIISYKKSN